MNVAAHTHLYFGIRNNSNVNGNTMTGTAASVRRPCSLREQQQQFDHLYEHDDHRGFFNGTQPVTNQLVLTLTAGTASVVATSGSPASNTFGDIEKLFLVTSGSFSVRADVKASDPFFALGQACPAVYDPTHTPASGSSDVSKVDLAFYYSDCGDGQIDSPEQCDLGAGNGASGSCCTSACTFRPSGAICRGGVDLQCDTSEACTGAAATCPPDDAPINGGSVCRTGSGDICDQNELCTGVRDRVLAGRRAREGRNRLPVVTVAGSGCDEAKSVPASGQHLPAG